ncbi:MAG: flagellar basal body L-ring protein FlgH [Desulfobacteraceae bacterium]|nr:flagellar basal body L-ring protein FlgH [Desulfobacteraceae bacterium]
MNKILWKTQTLFIGVLLLIFAGCATKSEVESPNLVIPEGMSTEPSIQPKYTDAPVAEGSLWSSTGSSMFEDDKAAHVGDTVVVDIIENSSSEMDVNTEAGRTTDMEAGVGLNLFGINTAFGGDGTANGNIDTSFKNSFEAEAKSDRSGQVTASIAARITEVLPNGNLSLFGRKAMKVNNEVQYILVSGVVRPKDISSENRVKSTSMADARIEYYGKGALADKQTPGWGNRLIDNLWPF